jgi:23S rRNA pseudouridine1911/1915/1917 synthase
VSNAAYGGGTTRARRSHIGDAAADYIQKLNRQALHAQLLGFQHPITSEFLSFKIPLPADLKILASLLQKPGNPG